MKRSDLFGNNDEANKEANKSDLFGKSNSKKVNEIKPPGKKRKIWKVSSVLKSEDNNL